MSIYQENILDHAKHPRHWGLLDPYDRHAQDENPLCGDHLELTLCIDENNIITALGWAGHGCAISQAAASILGEEMLGKSLEDVQHLSKDEILEWLGIPLSTSRLKCALLSLKVAKAAAYNLERWIGDDE